MGKAIYQPNGSAEEYSQWAVNFYNGCSGRCQYCYNRRFSNLLGKEKPTLKKTLVSPEKALETFELELKTHLHDLQEHGLLFNFVSDPFLPETELLNTMAMCICMKNDVPIKILTKQTHWVEPFLNEIASNGTIWNHEPKTHLFNVGFTLTGHDELEPGCSLNRERIEAMNLLHEQGITTWASIEPIINFDSSLLMIFLSSPYCDHYKIGLQSRRKYSLCGVTNFFGSVSYALYQQNKIREVTVYWKQSIRELLRMDQFNDNFCVDANYKFWKND